MQYNAPNRIYVYQKFCGADTPRTSFCAGTQNRAPPLQNPGNAPGTMMPFDGRYQPLSHSMHLWDFYGSSHCFRNINVSSV